MRRYIIFTFLIFGCYVYPQKYTNKQLDSLYGIINSDIYYNDNGIKKANELLKSAEFNNNKNMIILSLLRIARIQSGQTDYINSLQNIDKAKKLALESNDYEKYILATCLEGKSFLFEDNYERTKKLIENAKLYISKIKDKEAQTRAKIEINTIKWWLSFFSETPNKSNSDAMIFAAGEIYTDALKLKDPKSKAKNIILACNFFSIPLIKEKKTNDVKFYLDIAQKYIKNLDTYSFTKGEYYENRGNYELINQAQNKKYLDSAIYNYQIALEISGKLGYLGLNNRVYPKIADAYGKTNNEEKQNYYIKLAKIQDENLDAIMNLASNKLKQKAYNISTEKNINKNNIVYLVIAVVILILCALFLRKIIKINKLNKIYSKLEKIDKIQNLNNTSAEANNLLYQVLKNDESSFYLNFIEKYPYFSDNLLKINSNIKNSDIEFCAYIKLNLETKQIANIKKISIKAVDGKKYRIRKKLNIPTTENIYVWMSQI